MKLEGSCHCGTVNLTVESPHPYPYMLCYCSICRKTAGTGGYAINLGAKADTLSVEGEDTVRTFHAILHDEGDKESPGERAFCSKCGTALWAFDERWRDLIHPHASAIDTDLPTPPERTHIMLASKASWVEPDIREEDKAFDVYPDESIADWHRRLGLEQS
ncbi:GFA family protein [Henriciella sp.]|uniref:GFA family protein n=1 Tax=Henriciella sp. TaxID=1968823 RepID=UPI002603D271|nr:GFA family protein [Henriciella sp.]